MTTVTFTEFRNQASGMLSQVEQGETLVVLRHGRPIAQVSPVRDPSDSPSSWKQPALRLSTKGIGLAEAIIEEREREGIS